MKICPLASGSSGNATFIKTEHTAILIDCGTSSYKKLKESLAQIGHSPDEISAIFITHEHTDHCQSLGTFYRKHQEVELYANFETSLAVDSIIAQKNPQLQLPWINFDSTTEISICDLIITPFSIPHDASNPVGYSIADGKHKLTIATDMGYVTPTAIQATTGSDALILETNYDPQMLEESDRSPSLIKRIKGRTGHLSNQDAAEFLARIAFQTPQLQTVYAAHISSECNTIDYATSALQIATRALHLPSTRILPTYPHTPSEITIF